MLDPTRRFRTTSETTEMDNRFITTAELIADTINVLLPKIIKDHKNLAGVIGIPRSGMLPASIISTKLGIPLYSLSGDTIVSISSFSNSGGSRMEHYVRHDGPLVFIDDTACSGIAATRIKRRFPEYAVASVYSTDKASKIIDHYGKMLKEPHLLEWNMFNSQLVKNALFDIDGIFCDNIPIKVCQDDRLYAEYLGNIQPLYSRIPTLFKAMALVTGRLERYRDITEKWLKQHGFNYHKLIMFPTELEGRRNSNHVFEVGTYKGKVMAEAEAALFVESEVLEAKIIRQTCQSGIIVCPNQGICL